jgi:lipopolysaccharide/colanic/teichoic acid biosynthesis glycosyltransferase
MVIDKGFSGNNKMTSTTIKTKIIAQTSSIVHRNNRKSGAALSPKAKSAGCRSWYCLLKSVMDRVLALVTIVLISPILGLIALAIKLDSRGSVLYHRAQVGEKGKTFTALKFRTMQMDNDESEYKEYVARYITENAPYKFDAYGQPIYKVVNDPRVTRFGAMLRRTNLDELPQLINIIRGEMSWIGPRPDVPFAVSMYQPWHLKRLDCKPGLTGLWQVCGRKSLSFKSMVRLDISYIKRQGMWLDLKIFFLTIYTILKRDGS